MRIFLIVLVIIVSLTASELKNYENGRFGFSGRYPSNIFVNQFYSDNGDGVILSSQNDQVKCTFSGINNVMKESLKDDYKSTLESFNKNNKKEITYKVLKKNWYVTSGYNYTNNTIFYQKRFLSNSNSGTMSIFSGFYIEYPIKDKKKYSNLVKTINKYFKPAIIIPVLSNTTVDVEVLENYQKACDDGNLKKCVIAGNFLNQPVKNEDIYNFDKAMSNYQKACDGGEWEACYFIARAIMKNPDVQDNDMLKALKLNKKACDGDIASACWYLGTMYEYGEGTQKNIALAKEYNKKACGLGHTSACSETNINTQMPTYNKPSDLCIDIDVQNTVIKVYSRELLSASIRSRRSLPISHFQKLRLTSVRFNGINTTSQTTYCAAAIQSTYGTREIEYSIQKTLDGGNYITVSFR